MDWASAWRQGAVAPWLDDSWQRDSCEWRTGNSLKYCHPICVTYQHKYLCPLENRTGKERRGREEYGTRVVDLGEKSSIR